MRLTGLWWWIDRWRKSTAFIDMSLEQQGAYRNLLDEAALRGGAIPNDEDVLAKACGDARRWKKLRPAVMNRFTLEQDGWHNETMDSVIAESRRRADKQRDYRHRNGNGDGNASGNGSGNNMAPPDPDLVFPPKTGEPRARGAGSRGGLLGGSMPIDHGECLAHGPICLKPRIAQELRPLFSSESALVGWATGVGEWWTAALERGDRLYTADAFKFWRTEYDRHFGSKPSAQANSAIAGADETAKYLDDLRSAR